MLQRKSAVARGTFGQARGLLAGTIDNLRVELVVALEINCALWIMIACLAIKASEFIVF